MKKFGIESNKEICCFKCGSIVFGPNCNQPTYARRDNPVFFSYLSELVLDLIY